MQSLSRNSFAASAYRQKKLALSNGADAAFKTTDQAHRGSPRSGVCVDFARPPYTSLVQKRHHHSLASVRPLELQACCPVIEEQATAAQLWWQGRHGILYRLAPFGRGPRGAVARNDVMLRAVPDLACRCSGIRFRPRSVYSKEATQSLAPLLLRPLTMF